MLCSISALIPTALAPRCSGITASFRLRRNNEIRSRTADVILYWIIMQDQVRFNAPFIIIMSIHKGSILNRQDAIQLSLGQSHSCLLMHHITKNVQLPGASSITPASCSSGIISGMPAIPERARLFPLSCITVERMLSRKSTGNQAWLSLEAISSYASVLNEAPNTDLLSTGSILPE